MRCVISLVIITSILYAEEISLREAIYLALKVNENKKISELNYSISDNKITQAESFLYPRINYSFDALRRDEDVTFDVSGELQLPSSFSALNVNSLPVSFSAVALGRDTIRNALSFNYIMSSGGKVESHINQAKISRRIHKNLLYKTKNDIKLETKKLYFQHEFMRDMFNVSSNIYEQFSVIAILTKSFYEGKSLKVNKTDYLRVQTMKYYLESIRNDFKKKMDLTRNNLLSFIGKDKESIKFEKSPFYGSHIKEELSSLKKIVLDKSKIMQISLDKIKLAEQNIIEARSRFLPNLVLHGETSSLYNNQETGLNTNENRENWFIGLSLKLPLYNAGLNTSNLSIKKIEKKISLYESEKTKKLLKLQLENSLSTFYSLFSQVENLEKSLSVAKENSILSLDGYKIEYFSTNDVIESQLLENFILSSYFKTIYNYKLSLAQIEWLYEYE